MTTIYFLRIGETEANVSNMLSNSSHLTEEGKVQVKDLCSRIKVTFEALYSSTLIPSIETAEIITSLQGNKVEQMSEFNEVNWGKWEGRKKIDFQTEVADFFNGRVRQIPGGELVENVVARMITGLNKVSERHPEGKICIIGHGASGRMMIAHLLGIPPHNFFKLPNRNASVTTFEYSPINGAKFDTILYGGGLDCVLRGSE